MARGWMGKNHPLSKGGLKHKLICVLPSGQVALTLFYKRWGRRVLNQSKLGGEISFRAPAFGQERFTRLRASTLGEGYTEAAIRAIIEGRAASAGGRSVAPRRVNLVIDIQSKMQSGKGPAFQRWATVYNLKQMAAAVQYLREHDLMDYALLEQRTAEVINRFHVLSDKIHVVEDGLKRNTELRAAVLDYAKNRPVFEEYKAKKYSNQYLAEHAAEISAYRAAQAAFRRILAGGKLPKMEALKAEAVRLTTEKKALYAEYRKARTDMRELMTVKANIDRLFGVTEDQKNKEMEQKFHDANKVDRPR